MTDPLGNLRLFRSEDIAAVMPMKRCIEVIEAVMRQVSAGEADLPLRTAMPIRGGGNRYGVMHGALTKPAVFGAKQISLFPDNPRQGRSSHIGLITVFDAQTGEPLAVLDAAKITALRTAAASAVATRALARPDARTLAILGTGEQAIAHLEAMLLVRPIDTVKVWGRDRTHVELFLARTSLNSDVRLLASETIAEALDGADIACTVTSSPVPLFGPELLPPGIHVNAVGASSPDVMEIDPAVVAAAYYVVDFRGSALAQAGELIAAIARGFIGVNRTLPEIGEVLAGDAPARTARDQITLYRSLGIIAQDLAVAAEVVLPGRDWAKNASQKLEGSKE
jgi:ornithine cyclodeaminase